MTFKTRAEDGTKNTAGKNIKRFRKSLKDKPSQRVFAEMLQRSGMDVDKNAVQKLEAGDRFINDNEIKIIAEVLEIAYEELLE